MTASWPCSIAISSLPCCVREPAGRPGLVRETPALPERGWLGSVLPLGLVPGTAPGSCLPEMIWSVIGQVAGLGQAGVVDREGEPASRASAAWTISAASAGRMVVPSRSKPKGCGPLALYCPASAWCRRAVSRPRSLVRHRAHDPGQGDAGVIGQPQRPAARPDRNPGCGLLNQVDQVGTPGSRRAARPGRQAT